MINDSQLRAAFEAQQVRYREDIEAAKLRYFLMGLVIGLGGCLALVITFISTRPAL